MEPFWHFYLMKVGKFEHFSEMHKITSWRKVLLAPSFGQTCDAVKYDGKEIPGEKFSSRICSKEEQKLSFPSTKWRNFSYFPKPCVLRHILADNFSLISPLACQPWLKAAQKLTHVRCCVENRIKQTINFMAHNFSCSESSLIMFSLQCSLKVPLVSGF